MLELDRTRLLKFMTQKNVQYEYFPELLAYTANAELRLINRVLLVWIYLAHSRFLSLSSDIILYFHFIFHLPILYQLPSYVV